MALALRLVAQLQNNFIAAIAPPPSGDALLLEDNLSNILLEDNSSKLLLE